MPEVKVKNYLLRARGNNPRVGTVQQPINGLKPKSHHRDSKYSREHMKSSNSRVRTLKTMTYVQKCLAKTIYFYSYFLFKSNCINFYILIQTTYFMKLVLIIQKLLDQVLRQDNLLLSCVKPGSRSHGFVFIQYVK